MWELEYKESWAPKNWGFWNMVLEKTLWQSLGLQGDPTSPSYRKSVLNIHWKDWCWSWNSNTLAPWCEELTHWKRPWCWERLKAGGEGDDRGWDSWMASLMRWTGVWVGSGTWWWTEEPGVLQSMGSQRVRHDWATELNWTETESQKSKRAKSHGPKVNSNISPEQNIKCSSDWLWPQKWVLPPPVQEF